MQYTVGENFTYDARDGAIGDTTIRSSGNSIPVLSSVCLSVRKLDIHNFSELTVNAGDIIKEANKKIYMNVLTVDEIFVVTVAGVDLVCRIAEIVAETAEDCDLNAEDSEQAGGCTDMDDYRGLADVTTVWLHLSPPLY